MTLNRHMESGLWIVANGISYRAGLSSRSSSGFTQGCVALSIEFSASNIHIYIFCYLLDPYKYTYVIYNEWTIFFNPKG